MSITEQTQDRASTAQPSVETMRVRGEALVAKVKALLQEGNVRRITVRNDQGHAIIEIPVTAGVVAAVIAPVLIAVAALAALASSLEIEIDRTPAQTAATRRAATPTDRAPST